MLDSDWFWSSFFDWLENLLLGTLWIPGCWMGHPAWIRFYFTLLPFLLLFIRANIVFVKQIFWQSVCLILYPLWFLYVITQHTSFMKCNHCLPSPYCVSDWWPGQVSSPVFLAMYLQGQYKYCEVPDMQGLLFSVHLCYFHISSAVCAIYPWVAQTPLQWPSLPDSVCN